MNSGFNLYLPPDASPARKEAHAAYKAAAEAAWLAKTADDYNRATDALVGAQRVYGMVLLAEDKARRPHIYSKDNTTPVSAPEHSLFEPILAVLRGYHTRVEQARQIIALFDQSQKESGFVP